MLRMICILGCLLFLGETFKSCKKKKREIWYLTSVFKDYCAFDTGSYWVYEDSATGQVDSQYLFECNTGLSTSEKSSANEEWYKRKIGSTIYYPFSIIGSSSLRSGSHTGLIEEFENQQVAWVYTFDSDTSPGFRIMYTTDKYYEVNKTLSSLMVKDSIYISVLHVLHEDVPTGDYIVEAWWCSKIGRVKFRRQNGSVWQLRKYRVIPKFK